MLSSWLRERQRKPWIVVSPTVQILVRMLSCHPTSTTAGGNFEHLELAQAGAVPRPSAHLCTVAIIEF